MSLAQDRGRLEARIEVLGTELETQKKQNEKNTDALKIKTKIVDDQTETIRKLKEVVVPTVTHLSSLYLESHKQTSVSSATSHRPRPCKNVMTKFAGCVRKQLRPKRSSNRIWRTRQPGRLS